MNQSVTRTNKVFIFWFYFVFINLIIGFNIKIGKIEIYFFLFLVFFIFLFFSKINKKKDIFVPFIFKVPSLLILSSYIFKLIYLSDVTTGDFLQMAKYLTFYFYSYTIVLLTQGLPLSDTIRFNNTLLKLLTLSVIYMGVIGLLQYFSPSIIQGYFNLFYGDSISTTSDLTIFEYAQITNRVSSIFPNAMVFGGAISLLTLSILFFKKGNYSKFDYLAIIVGTLSLILTNTRAALIGFFVAITIWLFLFNRRKVIPFVFLLLGFLIFQQVILKPKEKYQEKNTIRFEEAYQFLSSGFSYEYMPKSLISRINQLDRGWEIFFKSKYIYSGVSKIFYLKNFYANRLSLHNQFNSWFILFGVFGIGLSLWFVYIIFVFYRKYKRINDRQLKQMFSSMYLLGISAFVTSLTQPALFGPRWIEFLFFYFTLVYVIYYKKIKLL